MAETEFWNLIAKVNATALDHGNEDAAVQPLQYALSALPEQKLADFGEVLSQKLYALDGKTYAQNAGESGDSDDGFLYARCYVVAKGQKFYESVLADPRKMVKSIDQWCEALLSVHWNAWADLTGNDASDWPFAASVSYESGSNETLWR